MKKDDMSNGSSFIHPSYPGASASGPGDTELCPVCLEKGEQVPMVRGMATGYYWQYRCQRCGNLALVEREKERHGDI